MQFFLDTAEMKEIETGLEWGMVDGITTNPSLIAKSGRPYLATVQEIARLVPGPVSGEVLATEYEEILTQGRRLAGLAENVVVKVPLTPAGLRAVATFKKEGIRTNVTLCFSPMQALLAAKAGAAYISPFVGRLDDIAEDGMELIENVVTIYHNYGCGTPSTFCSRRCWGRTWSRSRSRCWSSSTSIRSRTPGSSVSPPTGRRPARASKSRRRGILGTT